MLRVPENVQRAILDVLDKRRATTIELVKIIFGRPTDVGEELVRRALRTLASAREVVSDNNSWLRWTEEKEKARQKEVREEKARRKKARRQEKAEQERARRTADEREKAISPSKPNKKLETLAKTLGMLGSDHEGEKLNAAEQAEKLRRELGMTWRQLMGLA
jgi:Zn finger protein HypA/HybF involved in hydrogenase expression